MLLDYHMHLVGDEEPTPEDVHLAHIGRYVATAITAGVEEIGFSDHVYRFSVARDWIDHDLWRAGHHRHRPLRRTISGARDAGLPV